MKSYLNSKEEKAQTAIEYLLLLTTVVTIVLIGFRVYLPHIRETSNIYFNRVAVGILGDPPHCGDGICQDGTGGTPEWFESRERCPVDC